MCIVLGLLSLSSFCGIVLPVFPLATPDLLLDRSDAVSAHSFGAEMDETHAETIPQTRRNTFRLRFQNRKDQEHTQSSLGTGRTRFLHTLLVHNWAMGTPRPPRTQAGVHLCDPLASQCPGERAQASLGTGRTRFLHTLLVRKYAASTPKPSQSTCLSYQVQCGRCLSGWVAAPLKVQAN